MQLRTLKEMLVQNISRDEGKYELLLTVQKSWCEYCAAAKSEAIKRWLLGLCEHGPKQRQTRTITSKPWQERMYVYQTFLSEHLFNCLFILR